MTPFSSPQNKRAAAQRTGASTYFSPTQTNAAASHDAELDRSNTIGGISARRANMATGSKRGREADNPEQGRTSKRPHVNYDPHIASLVENHRRTPNDAVSLKLGEEYDQDQDWRPSNGYQPKTITQSSKSASCRPTGLFKPQNTLNNVAQHAVNRGNPPTLSVNKDSRHARPQTSRLHATDLRANRPPDAIYVSEGSNVKTGSSIVDIMTGHNAVRRHKSNESARAADQVDLTSEAEEDLGHAVGRTGDQKQKFSPSNPVRHSGQLSRRKAKPPDPFARNESKVVDIYMNPQWIKKQRSNGSMQSSFEEKASGSYASQNGQSQQISGDEHSSIQAHDDHWPRRCGEAVQSAAQDPQDVNNNERLKINLMQDMDQATSQYHQRHDKGGTKQGLEQRSAHGVDGAMKLLRNITRSDKSTHLRPTAKPKDDVFNNNSVNKTPDAEPEVPNLRHTFVREDPVSRRAHQKTKLVRNMQSTSASNEPNDDDDELQNGNTVLFRKSPKRSSQEAVSQAFKASSILPSGPVTRGLPLYSQHASQTMRHPLPSEDEEDGKEQFERIPVKQFLSEVYASTKNGHELVWDNARQRFFVECNEQKIHIPGKQILVFIEKPNVRTQWSENRDMRKAYLKGSSSFHSSGNVLLEFSKPADLSRCFELLQSATKQRFAPKLISSEEMEKIFVTQSHELISAYRKRKGSAQPELQTASSQDASDGFEEQIKYDMLSEDEAKPTRTTARSRMQGGDTLGDAFLEDDLQKPRQVRQSPSTTSRHFEPPRRSLREVRPAKTRSPSPPIRWTEANKLPEWSHSLVYPPTGRIRATVDFENLKRLDEGEYLNDSIVDFQLRYIQLHMSPEHQSKVHFFNTFFYTALQRKEGKREFNYDAVKRWTRGVDLFTFPYVVVPINVSLHWFVVIICNLPNAARKFSGFDNDVETSGDDSDDDEVAEQLLNGLNPAGELDLIASSSDESQNLTSRQSVDLKEHRGAQPKRPGSAPGKKSKKKPPSLRKYDLDEPILITLDSLGVGRSTELRYLKHYVSAEAEERRGIKVDPSELQGMTAKGLPEQPNFCDCGVYLIGYITEFAKDPEKFVNSVLRREMDKNEAFADFDPSAKRGEIRDLILKLHGEQEAERKALKKTKAAAMKAQDPQSAPQSSNTPNMAPTQLLVVQETSTSTPSQAEELAVSPVQQLTPRGLGKGGLPESSQNLNADLDEDDDDDENLEMCAPRAMCQDQPQGRHSSISAPAGDESDSDDEMLDDIPAGQASSSPDRRNRDILLKQEDGHPLLETLRAAVQQSEIPPAKARPTQPARDVPAHRLSPRVAQAYVEIRKRPVVVDLESEDEGHLLEVPDSQERRDG